MTRFFTKHYKDLTQCTSKEKEIYGVIESLSKKGTISLRYTQAKLAKLCNCCVRTLQRTLTKFLNLGWIIKEHFKCRYERRIKVVIQLVKNTVQKAVESTSKMSHDLRQNVVHIYNKITDRERDDSISLSIITEKEKKSEIEFGFALGGQPNPTREGKCSSLGDVLSTVLEEIPVLEGQYSSAREELLEEPLKPQEIHVSDRGIFGSIMNLLNKGSLPTTCALLRNFLEYYFEAYGEKFPQEIINEYIARRGV